MKSDISIKPLRQSASLILPFSDKGIDAHRILMLNRKPHMSFAKALVFPGGVCEQRDQKYVQNKQFVEFAKITAIRELFQETKIVLLPPSVTTEQINILKSRFINSGQSNLIDQISNIWSNNLHSLIPIARFITPQFPKMSRYDCMFYIVQEGIIRMNFGDKESLEHLNIQQEQSSQYFWKQPSQFLKIYNQKSYFLAPPQNIILNALLRIGANNTSSYLKILDPQLTIQPLLGDFRNKKDFLLAGDQEYYSLELLNKEPQSRSSQQINQTIAKLGSNAKEGSKRRVVPKNSSDFSNIMYVYNGLAEQSTILRYLQSFIPSSSL